MRFIKNFQDPVCDTCANGNWTNGTTCICTRNNEVVRDDGLITDHFAACLGAAYKRAKKEAKRGK